MKICNCRLFRSSEEPVYLQIKMKIISWWKSYVENHHFRSFRSLVRQLILSSIEKGIVITFTYVKEINPISPLVSKKTIRECCHLLNFTNLHYSAGSSNIYIVQDYQPYLAIVLLFPLRFALF